VTYQPTDSNAPTAPAYPPAPATTAAYPPVPGQASAPSAQPPAPRKGSALTWVFAILMILFLAGAGGLGYFYNEARSTAAEQKGQIETLQGKVDSQAKDLTSSQDRLKDAQDDLAAAEDDLETLRGCQAAVQTFVDSIGGSDAAGEAAALEMFKACDAQL
jgi:uncharacterized protein HemX